MNEWCCEFFFFFFRTFVQLLLSNYVGGNGACVVVLCWKFCILNLSTFFAPQDICQYVCQAKVLILMRRYVFLYAWANKNEFLIRNGNGGTERVS